jgi:hypothetical protein
MPVGVWWQNLKGRDHIEDLGVGDVGNVDDDDDDRMDFQEIC